MLEQISILAPLYRLVRALYCQLSTQLSFSQEVARRIRPSQRNKTGVPIVRYVFCLWVLTL